MVNEVNQNKFLNEIKEGVTVVDFFAQWCGPCKMLSPVLDSIAEEMNNKVNFIKVDVDECDEIADKYEISSIPAIVIFKNGEEQERIVGFNPKDTLVEIINKHI